MTDIICNALNNKSFQVSLDSFSEIFFIQERFVSARAPLFISKSDKGHKLATKVYSYQDDFPSTFFLNESRYSFLRHPNVISIRHSVNKLTIPKPDRSSINCSLLFMDLACCDFKDLMSSTRFDEKLARTFFHHLVDGVTYIHSKGVSHMDLKLENLLLGADFMLKLADFDFSYKEGDLVLLGHGTLNFRAPEVIQRDCRDPKMADIFSLGVLLFCFVLGHIPFSEQEKIKGFDLFNLMMDDPEGYWEALRDIQGVLPVGNDFVELFMSMVCRDPSKRASLNSIRKSSWYKKPVYSQKELESLLKSKLPLNYSEL